MELIVRQYNPSFLNLWNKFVESSNEGTIFHRIDFLNYHGSKFSENEHHLLFFNEDKLFGIMPMAIFKENEICIAKSPYGASFGGPVFSKPLNYIDSQQIISVLLDYLKTIQVKQLEMNLPGSIHYKQFSETLRLVLFEQGFICINRDIISAVSLDSSLSTTKMMDRRFKKISQNAVRKANSFGVKIIHNASIDDFWEVLQLTYDKHGTKPTHSYVEFQSLHQSFHKKIYADVAYYNEKPIAGIGFFILNNSVISTFYLAQDVKHQQTQALSLLIYHAILRAQEEGFKWFDFGTSSINMKGRENIFKFKESFGAIGIFREKYVWKA